MKTVKGIAGSAVELRIPDMPEAAPLVTHWLITAPVYHPAWSQYVLACVKLDDLPDFTPAHRQYEGTTHEVIVAALDPKSGPYDEDKMLSYAPKGDLPILWPINIAHQFIATDDEMRQLCGWAAIGVVNGWLNPETADAPERIRQDWLASLTKTLAHIRGEVHAP